jgi:hypothetical protein
VTHVAAKVPTDPKLREVTGSEGSSTANNRKEHQGYQYQ